MFFSKRAYIGIDLTGGRTFTYAALDADMKLLALADGGMEDALTFIGGQASAVVAINAPARPNQGRVRALLEAESLEKDKSPLRGADMRLAEHELRQRGIKVAATPSHPDRCTAWMRAGFKLFEKLSKLGFATFPAEDAEYQVLETHPQAAFIALTEGNLLPASSLGGRLQRQAVLYGEGAEIRDPMIFFEEITRYKLKQGVMPFEQVYATNQLDALLAAYTAWLTASKPESTFALGDAEEGKIYLPVSMLKAKY